MSLPINVKHLRLNQHVQANKQKKRLKVVNCINPSTCIISNTSTAGKFVHALCVRAPKFDYNSAFIAVLWSTRTLPAVEVFHTWHKGCGARSLCGITEIRRCTTITQDSMQGQLAGAGTALLRHLFHTHPRAQ